MKTNRLLDQLLNVLNQESQQYRLMLTVIDKEKDAAVRLKLNRLNEAGWEKEKILIKLRRLEEQRCLLVIRLAETLGHPSQDLTLTMISEMVGEPFAGRLKQAADNLRTLLGTLGEANRLSRRLFEHSLAFLRGSFNILHEMMESNPVYYRTGNIQHASATGKWVCGEI